MKTDIVFKDKRWRILPLDEIARVSFSAVENDILDDEDDFEISILATNDFELIELNKKFRNHTKSTNILSWPEYNYKRVEPGGTPERTPKRLKFFESPRFLGNIAISFDQCSIEADERNINFSHHITHLLIHGCLHLIGFDHENELDAARMENVEKRLLLELGIENPYMVNDR